MQCHFKITPVGTCRSVTLRMRHNQEAYTVLNFFCVATQVFPWTKISIFPFMSESESFYLQNLSTVKCRWCCVLRHNPNSPETMEYSIKHFVFRSSNIIFSWRGGFGWKTTDSNPCIRIFKVRNFLKVIRNFDSPRLMNWCFSVTVAVIFFMRVRISVFTVRKKDTIPSSVICFFCIKVKIYWESNFL